MELIHLHELLKKLDLSHLIGELASPSTVLEAADTLQMQLNELENYYKPTLTFEGINLFIEKIKLHIVGSSIFVRPSFLPNGNTKLDSLLLSNELLVLHKTSTAIFGYNLNKGGFFRVPNTNDYLESGEIDIEHSLLPINLTNFPVNQYGNFLAIEYVIKFGIPLLKRN